MALRAARVGRGPGLTAFRIPLTMMKRMRRNLIAGLLIAGELALMAGDEVDVTPPGGSPVGYRVTARSIVAPTAVQILQPTSDVRLTLFTCWPTWVDTQRVVVTAIPAPST